MATKLGGLEQNWGGCTLWPRPKTATGVCVHDNSASSNASDYVKQLTFLSCSEVAFSSAFPFLVFTSLHLVEICTLMSAFYFKLYLHSGQL